MLAINQNIYTIFTFGTARDAAAAAAAAAERTSSTFLFLTRDFTCMLIIFDVRTLFMIDKRKGERTSAAYPFATATISL